MKDKVIVVTGASQGIGKEISRQLGLLGGKIILVARSRENLIITNNEMETQGIQSCFYCGDCSDFQNCLDLREFVISKFGRIDILINNAAIAITGTLSETNHTLFQDSQLININGSIFPTKVFLSDIRSSRGRVMFISSLAGIIGLPSHGIYSASKRAILSYAETIRNEEREYGVFVGVHFPGFTENDKNKKIVTGNGSIITLENRVNIKKSSKNRTALRIIRQINRRKFFGFTNIYGKLLFIGYRLFPRLFLNLLYVKRKSFAGA